MQSDHEKQSELQLINIIRDAIKTDEALREKYQVENKFRFVRDRLHALLTNLETELQAHQSQTKTIAMRQAEADEVLVYVYLYNAQGTALQNWQSMLNPKFFYEYGFNRPIYSQKEHVDALVKSKSNKLQHAYLTVAVKKDHIISLDADTAGKDSLNNPLIKIKEGGLRFEKLICFTHNNIDYLLDPEQGLVKKS